MNLQFRTERLFESAHRKHEIRIMAQLLFAQELSGLNSQKYDANINSALNILESCFEKNGCVTLFAAQEAENALSALQKCAKSYEVICCGHAHIDMNWLWRYDETVSLTLDTFRTVLNLLKEYPEFKFSQSQAAVYEIVEKHDPEMLKEIKKYVREGRWELTACTWVEADRNMPGSESMARHMLYSKKYLKDIFDVPDSSFLVDFEPDTFGHSAYVPDIIASGGIKYYYHCRGNNENRLYKWRSPFGGEVICYRDPYFYLGPVTYKTGLEAAQFCEAHGTNVHLRVFGVGDHGGGPTRRDLEAVAELASWPVFPHIKFGTFKEFFEKAEKATRLKTVQRELNCIFTGCYTSQSRIKQANRYGESKLFETEMFSAIAANIANLPYPHERLEKAWRKILFNQFHDILPGTGITDTREHALGEFQNAIAVADTQKTKALRAIAALADTSEYITDENISGTTSEGAGPGFGAGQGMAGIIEPLGSGAPMPFRISQSERGRGINRIFHIFNPSAHERTQTVELTMFDWNGSYSRLAVFNADGVKIEHQLADSAPVEYWQHKYMRILVTVTLPAAGRTVVLCTQDESAVLNTPGYKTEDDYVRELPFLYELENEYIKAVIDKSSGALVSFYDKERNKELISGGGAHFKLYNEQPSENTAGTSWTVGRYRKAAALTDDISIKTTLSGKLKKCVTVKAKSGLSTVAYSVSLSKQSRFLDIFCEADWREFGTAGENTPQLSFHLPLALACEEFAHDIPGGIIRRAPRAQDVPCQSFAAADYGGAAVMLVSDSKYGFRCESSAKNAEINLTCIRSSTDPDPCAEIGRHQFRIGIGLCGTSNTSMLNSAFDFCHLPLSISDLPRKGTRAKSEQLLKVCGGYLHAVKAAEGGTEIVLRVSRQDDDGGQISVTLPGEIKSAEAADIHESQCNNTKISFTDNTIYIYAENKRIITVKAAVSSMSF